MACWLGHRATGGAEKLDTSSRAVGWAVTAVIAASGEPVAAQAFGPVAEIVRENRWFPTRSLNPRGGACMKQGRQTAQRSKPQKGRASPGAEGAGGGNPGSTGLCRRGRQRGAEPHGRFGGFRPRTTFGLCGRVRSGWAKHPRRGREERLGSVLVSEVQLNAMVGALRACLRC